MRKKQKRAFFLTLRETFCVKGIIEQAANKLKEDSVSPYFRLGEGQQGVTWFFFPGKKIDIFLVLV
jgi:hypothetical protein